MKGWYGESYRHGLASRGIKSRAIINPIASPEMFDPKIYGPGTPKGIREFRGSGLTVVNERDVIEKINEIIDVANQGKLSHVKGRLDTPIEIKSIYIVGSRVSGFHKEGSDIDVYIQLKQTNNYPQDFDYIDRVVSRIDETLDKLDTDVFGLGIEKDGDWIKIDIFYDWEHPNENIPDRPVLKIWETGT